MDYNEETHWSLRIKNFLFGPPIPTEFAHKQKLPKYLGLSIFSSDALSSVAYATEEIMLVLAKSPAFLISPLSLLWVSTPIAIAICLLISVVSISYYQTIHAYPDGGGSYIVAKENLGDFAGQVAGASLLIDYVLTVAVSVTAGCLALISLYPNLQHIIIELAVGFIAAIALINLRGIKESGFFFALPTYTFIFSIFILIIKGFFTQSHSIPPAVTDKFLDISNIGLFLILKAFASGCTALTGIEAISNGVQAFKPPESKNASLTLLLMAVCLMGMFFGITFLAHKFSVIPNTMEGSTAYQTVLAQICEKIFGRGLFYSFLQIITAIILIIAANTAFADFPRLASLMARDGHLPRYMMNIGDRLVYQNGIGVLASFAILLILAFKAQLNHLIPLYAIGVFLSFTLSQWGMVIHSWNKKRKLTAYISLIGGTVTFLVMGIILITKFTAGAWTIPIVLGIILFFFRSVDSHYFNLQKKLSLGKDFKIMPHKEHKAIILIPRLNKGVVEALRYAYSTTKNCQAIHVITHEEKAHLVQKEWRKAGFSSHLMLLESPYRSLIEPILSYINKTIIDSPDLIITVIVPQGIYKTRWESMLHRNIANRLSRVLGNYSNVVVTRYNYFLD